MQASATVGLTWFLACAGIAPLFPGYEARAGSVSLPGVGGDLQVKVVSYKEARFQTVFKQYHDFSCGSAALASLLTFHYQDRTDEQQVFQTMYSLGDQARIRQQGFSLLDMKDFLGNRGYQADGFRMPLDTYREKARVPAIVLVNTRGYRHFILIKGIREDRVLVGDPATGVRSMRREEFDLAWNGLLFLIRSHAEVGRSSFNRAEEWAVNERAPFGTAFQNQGLANFTLFLPRLQDY